MKTASEYYDDKYEYYDLNKTKDVFKFAEAFATEQLKEKDNRIKELEEALPNLISVFKLFINGDIKIEVGEYPEVIKIVEQLLAKQ